MNPLDVLLCLSQVGRNLGDRNLSELLSTSPNFDENGP
jgi:hypothetical protein